MIEAVLLLALASATPRPMEIDDVLAFRAPSDPQISPAGRRGASVTTRLDLEKNVQPSDLWLVPAGGGKPIPSSDSKRLAYAGWPSPALPGAREGSGFVVDAGGGDTRPFTDMPGGERWTR